MHLNDALNVVGRDELCSWFDVTQLATASVGAAGLALARFMSRDGKDVASVEVDRRLASLWFGWSIRPQGWEMPAPWDPLSGDYQSRDGWIKLHTNAPHHRAAALRVLGALTDKRAVAKEVENWKASSLETAIIEEGGCTAQMRSLGEWQEHPQGRAVALEPIVNWNFRDINFCPSRIKIDPRRPLSGIRVLDLTRVLAGPVGARFLAAYGADVLRIDPPKWEEPGVIPEVTLGKRCAGINLKEKEDRQIFEALLRDADILMHGYRPGALDGLGYSMAERANINPDLIDVSLCAYGWTGPWATRRGFDSLVQMSSGIANFGMVQSQSAMPKPLPVQALDHATGYLLAAAAIEALHQRLAHKVISSAQLSLARTAHLLISSARQNSQKPFAPETIADLEDILEETDWGQAYRVRFPLQIGETPHKFDYPATALRTTQPAWVG